MKPKTLISHHENTRESLPHYEDLAFVSRRIIETLENRLSGTWQHIYIGETIAQLDAHVLEMMEKGLLSFETLSHIYESRTLGKVASTSEDANDNLLKVVNTFENQIIYFPDHEVALTVIYFYTTDHSWPEFQCYAQSAEKALKFLKDINEKLRQMLMQSVTFLVDTEDGVKRRNYGEHAVVSREDVMLEESIKQDIFRSIDQFFTADGQFFKEYGLPYKRGILLYGSPGNGKTTLVKSITGSTNAPVVYWQITEFTGSHSIQEVFGIVTRLAPAILVIEDIDSMPEYTRSVFLNTLDGTQSREGLFIIGTTNYPHKIDPALINRAGRFDRAYEIPAPSLTVREHYLRKMDLKDIFSQEQVHDMAKLTKGLSISQLNELYMSVALNWHYDGELAYEERIKELQKQNKRSKKNDWEHEEASIGF
ncbi:ATP-binding protein [Paenisporosarcina quisquiliarum]|uniref:ATP-binding protein n=1 Tax=Paenisporosarcina quisquiliarum TaxID=365346 RepID=A0A9X3LDR5_9BACL|nr:ATP-binding protein [Paenisporosarcina quisquiliarum]MCZ8536008.1 ATP-binding protein [Paenisporosarcina quisquiliarum]